MADTLDTSVRCFPELTDEEVRLISKFTKMQAPRDFMLGWLTDRTMGGAYVALLWMNDQLIGWASMIPHGVGLALLGTLVAAGYRHQGFGRLILDTLLSHVAALPYLGNGGGPYSHICYRPESLSTFFHPCAERWGFLDFVTDQEGYVERYHAKNSA